jgi:predicted small integral membrane protein
VILRVSKIALVAAVAFFFTLVVFNNVTDYASNYQFVHHVLLMDSTFPGNRGMWRAIHLSWMHAAFYNSIILCEAVIAAWLWSGALRLLRAVRRSAADFERAKSLAAGGLVFGMLLWFVAFLSVGSEWFLMWQSRDWNGQEAAFRMFTVIGVVLLVLLVREPQEAGPQA